MSLHVLVTGAGGVYGEATVAGLRRASLPVRITAGDVHWHAAGALGSDDPIVLPRVSDPSYRARIVDIVRTRGIQAVFVCSGTEIRALVDHRQDLESETGALFVLPPPDLYRTASDKLETAKTLAAHGLASPITASSRDLGDLLERVPFPLFAKPRFGQGSRGIRVCKGPEDLAEVCALEEEYVVQELLGDDDEEFTVGVVATETGAVLGSIVLRRWLAGGQTGACETVEPGPIATYAEAIAAALRPRGYLNVQMRLRDGEPVAFELNARVSSSTGFRALAGFNEPELILRHYVLRERPGRPEIRRLTMVRGLSERIVEPAIWDRARANHA
jgi:carbamoyl-phosphate synthase large subunit